MLRMKVSELASYIFSLQIFRLAIASYVVIGMPKSPVRSVNYNNYTIYAQ